MKGGLHRGSTREAMQLKTRQHGRHMGASWSSDTDASIGTVEGRRGSEEGHRAETKTQSGESEGERRRRGIHAFWSGAGSLVGGPLARTYDYIHAANIHSTSASRTTGMGRLPQRRTGGRRPWAALDVAELGTNKNRNIPGG